MAETYEIVRYYRDYPGGHEISHTGLTLEQAQAHCKDPETSSTTATSAQAQARTAEYGPWFDGYRLERPDS
jgi:hypothetical protein